MGYFPEWQLEHARPRVGGDSPYDHSVLAVVSEAERTRCGGGHRVGGAGLCGHPQDVVAAARQHSAQDRRGHHGPPRGICPHHLPGSRQAHQDRACSKWSAPSTPSRSRPRKARASTASTFRWTRWNRPRDAGAWCGAFLWDRCSRSRPSTSRLNLVAHKVAPAIAAGCPHHPEAGAADPDLVAACWPRSCDDTLVAGWRVSRSCRCRMTSAGHAGRRRSHQAADLHRQRRRGLATQEPGGQEASDAGTRRQRRRHRSQRRRSGVCGATLRRRRLLLRRTDLHFGAANPGAPADLRTVHRAAGGGRAQAEVRRSHAGETHRRSSADSRAGRGPRRANGSTRPCRPARSCCAAASATAPWSSRRC